MTFYLRARTLCTLWLSDIMTIQSSVYLQVSLRPNNLLWAADCLIELAWAEEKSRIGLTLYFILSQFVSSYKSYRHSLSDPQIDRLE